MATCLLCGRETRSLFSARDYRRPFDVREHTVNWCSRCSFGRLGGVFSPAEVREFYNIPYYTHATKLDSPSPNSFIDRLIGHLSWRVDYGKALLPEEIGASNGRTLCDIGCGSGYHLREFKNAGFQVVGIEPDEVARNLAKQVSDVFDGTAENLPAELSAGQFDVILLSHVLEHCIDVGLAISNIKSILRPGGAVIIEVPNNAAKGFFRFEAFWPWSDVPRHINFFTEKSLRIALAKHGFAITEVHHVGYFRQFSPSWFAATNDIWEEIGTGKRPNFKFSIYLNFFETAFASAASKYDSVRIRAVPMKAA